VGGVQRFLEDQGQGFDVGVTFVPRVPCAGIFDLAIGDYTSRPTAQMALDACLAAKNEMPEQGSVGVGMGATIGKFFGVKQGMRGGFGASREVSANGAEVLAFAAVNAYGDIWWPGRAEMLAGTRAAPDDFTLVNSGDLMIRGWHRAGYGADVKIVSPASDQPSDVRKSSQPGPENTTLIVLITTARLDFQSARKVAEACHNGLSDVIYPAHTIYDGDLSMACSIGAIEENIVTLCLLAQRATSTAILNGVQAASSYPGVPSWSELCRHIQ
jgi:L-aminopeptidase/D-esterase-like protein